MSPTVLLKAGLIAAPGGRFVADLWIRDGWITGVGAGAAAADRVIDAMGLVVLPGWVLPVIPADPAAAPPHRSYAGAGITCAGWAGGEPRGRWCCDAAPMETIDTAARLAGAPGAIHERGRVAFVLPASRRGLLDAAAEVLARLRATLVIVADGAERSAAYAAERAAARGGRVVVGPLREPAALRRAWSAGAFVATDPAWLIDDPSLWRQVGLGAVRLLMSASGLPPPGIDALYRSGPARGLVGMEALAALIAARPAALLGCGAKGALLPGREADLCLLEPSGADAVIVETLLRGAAVARPHGRLIRGEPVDGLW